MSNTRFNTTEILDALFELCPSERYDRQIGVGHANKRIRSTLCHPREALAVLQRRFGDDGLIASRVAKPNVFSELQIVPALCQPGGAVIALRASSADSVFDLLTARGSLVGDQHPVLSAMADGRRAALAEQTGMLLAAQRIQDVATLDMLNLPATCGFGLSGMDLAKCRQMDVLFGEGLPRFEVLDPATEERGEADEIDADEDLHWEPPDPKENWAHRPMLVLFDGLKRRPGDEPSRWLRNTAGWLMKVRRHAGVPFAGIWVWQPDDEFLERLKFAFQQKDRTQIREVVLRSLTSLVDIESVVESVGDSCGETPSYLTARSRLNRQLTVGATQPAAQGGQLADFSEAYDSAVYREFAEPLIRWASENPNPVIRAAGRTSTVVDVSA